MLNVIANSLMVASRVPSPRHAQEIASAHDHETARTRAPGRLPPFLQLRASLTTGTSTPDTQRRAHGARRLPGIRLTV